MEDPLSKARILLADDHLLVAEALKKLLEPEFEIIGTVGDGRKLCAHRRRTKAGPHPDRPQHAIAERAWTLALN